MTGANLLPLTASVALAAIQALSAEVRDLKAQLTAALADRQAES